MKTGRGVMCIDQTCWWWPSATTFCRRERSHLAKR